MTLRHFGRLPSVPDAKDKLFAMDAPHPSRAVPLAKTWRYAHPVLDQGSHPFCVAYAWTAMLLASPISAKKGFPFGNPLGIKNFAANLYDQAQQLDGIPGTDYEGTTVRGGAKALKANNYVVSYLWGINADTVGRYILSRGPVVIGVDWYLGMMDLKPDKIARMTGGALGGHAALLIGYDSRRAMFRVLNSWGASWGANGRCWLPADTLERLLRDGGEACSAIEVPR